MNTLLDKEIDLNDKDLLQTNSYVKSLADLILNSPINTPMTIGLFGEWGSGKSSIVKTLQTNLTNDKTQKIKFVVYDAWKYSNDSFRRMFLLKVQNALGLKQTDKMSSFYLNRNTEVDIQRTFNLPYLTLIIVALMFVLGAYSLIGSPGKGTITILAALSILGFLSTVFSKAFNEYKVTTQQPFLFAPEQFEECFNEMVSKALKKPTTLSKVSNFIKGSEHGDIDKLIIVIDNIDRCHKDTAYELLTNTKNFIDTRLDVIFLIPVDDNALKKHIFSDTSKNSRESEEFLRKYFNITIRIKPYKITEIFDFADSINKENNLGFKPDTINIIAKEYASNPRRIIQFYNNLQLELIVMNSKYGKEFIENNEIAICKFLIIREEWNDEYIKLCRHPEIFFTDDYQTQKRKNSAGYLEFLESTYVSTRSVDFQTLQKILVNSDNYDSLPETIISKIKENNFSELEEILSETGYTYKKVIDYLLFSLNKAITSDLFTTDIPDLLDQIYLVLSNVSELDNSYYDRLEGDIRKRIDIHINNARSPENLVKFSNHALGRGNRFMEDALVKHFQNFEHDDTMFYEPPLFDLYEAYYRSASDAQLDLAVKGFPNYLNSTKVTDKVDRKLRPHALFVLYKQDIILKYMRDNTVEIWNDDINYGSWLYLATQLPDATELLTALYKGAEASLSTYNINEFLFVTKFNAILKTAKVSGEDQELSALIDRVNNNIFLVVRLSTTNYLQNINEDQKSETINYLFESYRVTGGSRISGNAIIQYCKLYGEESVKKHLGQLIKSIDNVNLGTLKPMIQTFQDIDENTNDILLHVLYTEVDGNPVYSDDEISIHLKRLVESILNDPKQEKLLLKHLDQSRTLKMMPDILNNLSETDFKKLPSSVQKVGFDQMVDKTVLPQYKTNFGVLGLIATNGSKKHVSALMNTIKSNLLDQEHVEETLDLILTIKELNSADAKDLTAYINSNKILEMGYEEKLNASLEKLASF